MQLIDNKELSNLLKSRGFSVPSTCKALGIDYQSVWNSFKRGSINSSTLFKLSNHTGIDLKEFTK